MDISEVIRLRKSCRSWADTPLSDEVIHAVLDLARLAPSAKNLQDWHVVVTRDPTVRKKLGEAASQGFVGQAPAVLTICGDQRAGAMSCGVPRWVVDATILIDHITLVATSMGLGTCWIGHFDQGRVKSVLGIPEQWEVIELLPLGYPADPSEVPKRRKSVREITSWDTWGGEPPKDFP